MNPLGKSFKFIILITVLVFTACETSVYEPEPIEEEVSFRFELMPIMGRSCASCHIEPDHPAPTPLAPASVAYETIMGGGYIIPGNAEASLWYKRLIGDPEIRSGRTMPPAEKLPQHEIELFKAWIEQGAQFN